MTILKTLQAILFILCFCCKTEAQSAADWQKLLEQSKIAIKYYGPEKTTGFGYMQEKSRTRSGQSLTINYADKSLKASLSFLNKKDHIELSADIESIAAAEEPCFTLRVEFPLEKAGEVYWNGSLGESTLVQRADSVYGNFVPVSTIITPKGGFNTTKTSNGGYTDMVGEGQMSFYPLASVTTSGAGYAWGIDMGLPVVYRLSYNPSLGMCAEFDLAISKQTTKFPNRTFFKLQLFGHDPVWKMRSALESYYGINAQYFDKKVTNEGIWLPFTALHTIENWQDFGFGFHETNWKTKDRGLKDRLPTIMADKSSGVASFQYTEPWDIQIPISKMDLSYEEVSKGSKVIPKEYSQSVMNTAALDKEGKFYARRLESPWFSTGWCVSITTNCDPELKSMNRYEYVRKDEIDPAIKLNVDGIYFDSMEWNWHHDLNYNKEHFAYADYPLTFSSSLDKARPAIWNYSSEYEMMSKIAGEMHMKGNLTMGNGFAWIPFSAGVLDLFGAEFNWYYAGDYDERILQFRRSISRQKPIVVLLNEGFDDKAFTTAPYDGYRQYFERMLFYGFFPSFFSADASSNPYWANKEKYNQGRPYFKKYIPLIKTVSAAGWEPVTHARADNKDILVERFGGNNGSEVYFTLMNSAAGVSKSFLDINIKELKLSGEPGALELITGEKLKTEKLNSGTLRIAIEIPEKSIRVVSINKM